MAAEQSYLVEAVLRLQEADRFRAGMEGAAKSTTGLETALGRMSAGAREVGSTLASLGAAAVSVGAKITTALAVAGAAGGALFARNTFENLGELEGKAIQLSAVLAAATQQPFEAMQKESGALFERFRTDAITSAGETKDFINVASMIAGPIAGAGHSMEELHDVTLAVMNAAPAMGIAFEQAGADTMRILQGVAGAHEPLFRAMQAIPALGIKSAEEFNKLAPEQRLEKVKKALGDPAFKAAAAAYGDSWKGVTSTLSDVLKTGGGLVASPLFEAAKRRLKSFNDAMLGTKPGEGLLSENGPLRRDLRTLGDTLTTRFHEIGGELARIFPSIDDGAMTTVGVLNHLAAAGLGKIRDGVSWVADHWDGIVDGAKAFAHWIDHSVERVEALTRALGGGDMGKGLERLAELYAGGRAANALAPAASGVAKIGQGVMGLFGGGSEAAAGPHGPPPFEGATWRAGGAGGGGKWTAGAAGEAVMAVGGGGAAEAGGGVAAAGAGLGGGGIVGSAAVLGVGAIGAAAQLDLFSKVIGDFGAVAEKAEAGWKPLVTSMDHLWDAGVHLYHAVKPILTVFEVLVALPMLPFVGVVYVLARHLDDAEIMVSKVADAFTYVTDGAAKAADALDNFIDGVLKKMGLDEKYSGPLAHAGAGAIEDATGLRDTLLEDWASAALKNLPARAPSMGHHGPRPAAGSGQKVEVTIKWDLGEGNDDAIYVKTREQIRKSLEAAKATPRVSRAHGMF